MTPKEKNFELYQIVSKAINDSAAHHKPSPDTLKRFQEQDARMDEIVAMMKQHMSEETRYRKEELQPLIETWKQYTGFGIVSQRVFSGTIKFLLGASVFIGSLYGLKEWLKK